METLDIAPIELGVALRALPGESECGDGYLAKPYQNGFLVAVVDGLGHGEEAAEAARLAVQILDLHAGETAIALMQRCHRALPGTRGVVTSLACFNFADETMTWLGVGNVEGLILRAEPAISPDRERLLLRGGVVGGQMPGLRAEVLSLHRGDTLIFVTDGIAHDFAERLNISDPPQMIAERILQQFRKNTDDALALVARYLGSAR
jgi:phosphoserine phosphatase RsbX